MDGGVALGLTSPTQSQLADEINGGAMDVKSPINGAASVADSTVSSRLYVSHLPSLSCIHTHTLSLSLSLTPCPCLLTVCMIGPLR